MFAAFSVNKIAAAIWLNYFTLTHMYQPGRCGLSSKDTLTMAVMAITKTTKSAVRTTDLVTLVRMLRVLISMAMVILSQFLVGLELT